MLLLESPTICLEIPFLIPGIPIHAPITSTVPKIPDIKGISTVFPKFELFLLLTFGCLTDWYVDALLKLLLNPLFLELLFGLKLLLVLLKLFFVGLKLLLF